MSLKTNSTTGLSDHPQAALKSDASQSSVSLGLDALTQRHTALVAVTPPSEPRAKVSTKERILNATETLFIARGFDGTSLRAITTEAAVNLAAVNYHFGSKEEMFTIVLTRRLDVMNADRLRRLDALEAAGLDAAHGVEQIIATLFLPALALARTIELGGEDFLRLLGRAYADPSPFVRELLAGRYVATNIRFKTAFTRALPELVEQDLAMRLHFILDSVSATLAAEDVRKLFNVLNGATTDDAAANDISFLSYFAPFLASGLRANVRQPKQIQALQKLAHTGTISAA